MSAFDDLIDFEEELVREGTRVPADIHHRAVVAGTHDHPRPGRDEAPRSLVNVAEEFGLTHGESKAVKEGGAWLDVQCGVTSRVTDQHGALRRGFGHAKAAKSLGPESALVHLWYLECMFWLIYLLSAILCIWGGCLLARVIANRLELGLFRRKQRKEAEASQHAATMPAVKKRSGWWTLLGLGVVVFGGVVAFLGYEAENVGTSWLKRSEDYRPFLVAVLIMSLGLSGGLIVVGWRFDPSLGRRRCPKCWYDLSGTKGLLCTECGHEAASERLLFKSRRSRMTIALALIPLLLVPIVHRGLYAWRVGWVGLIPTTVMVVAWEWLPESVVGSFNSGWWGTGRQTPGTLLARVEQRELWDWQNAILQWRQEAALANSKTSKQVIRASALSGRGSTDASIPYAVRPRFARLVLDTDWNDAESRLATQQLLSWVNAFPDADALRAEIADGVATIKPAILTQLAGQPTTWGTDGMELLMLPGVVERLTEDEWAVISQRMFGSQMSSFQRRSAVYTVAQASPEHLSRLILGAADSLQPSVLAEVLGIAMHQVTTEALDEKAVSLIRTSQFPAASELLKQLSSVDSPRVRRAAFDRFALDFAGGREALLGLGKPPFNYRTSPTYYEMSTEDARMLTLVLGKIVQRGVDDDLLLAAFDVMSWDPRYSQPLLNELRNFLDAHPDSPSAARVRTILRRHSQE